jgi:hypothetical protein
MEPRGSAGRSASVVCSEFEAQKNATAKPETDQMQVTGISKSCRIARVAPFFSGANAQSELDVAGVPGAAMTAIRTRLLRVCAG